MPRIDRLAREHSPPNRGLFYKKESIADLFYEKELVVDLFRRKNLIMDLFFEKELVVDIFVVSCLRNESNHGLIF